MYDYRKGVERIDRILSNKEGFEELKYIPSPSELTYKNGFYVSCSSIFIDIRRSSNLTDSHTRPVLARLYRAFISEVVAVLRSSGNCRHIEIQGDCVSGIFNTQYKTDIDVLFGTAAQILSLIDILNHKFRERGMVNIYAGIGISYGGALMVKAGLKGSGEDGVVWIGDVVNKASNLSGGENAIHVCNIIYLNLKDEYKSFCRLEWSQKLNENYHSAQPYNVLMNNWLEEDQKYRSNSLALYNGKAVYGLPQKIHRNFMEK